MRYVSRKLLKNGKNETQKNISGKNNLKMFFEIDDKIYCFIMYGILSWSKVFPDLVVALFWEKKTCHATYVRVNEYPYAFQNGVQTNFTQSLFYYLEETGTE